MRTLKNGNILTAEDEGELKRAYGDLGAKEFVEMKPEGMDNRLYYHSFNLAYTYGHTGGLTMEEAIDNYVEVFCKGGSTR